MIQNGTEENEALPFASEAEEIAHLRSEIRSQRELAKNLDARKKSLEAQISQLKQEMTKLKQQLDYWQKRFYGRMSEKRHLPLDPNQLSLFTPEELAQMSPEERQELEAEAQRQEETITKTVTVRNQPKRKPLDTTGLTVVEKHLYPEGTTDAGGKLLESYVEIGIEEIGRAHV